MAALEGRLVLSVAAAPSKGMSTQSDYGHLSPAEIAQSNASEIPFGFDTSETLQSNLPVAEQSTTTFNDQMTQTESLIEMPDTANNTITTDKTINLRNIGGTASVVQTEIFSAGKPTATRIQHPLLR